MGFGGSSISRHVKYVHSLECVHCAKYRVEGAVVNMERHDRAAVCIINPCFDLDLY